MIPEEFKAWLKEHQQDAEVQALATSILPPMTRERMEALLADPSVYRLIQPTIDRAVDQAIRTHDEKQAPLIAERITKAVSEAKSTAAEEATMSAEQRLEKRIAEMQARLDEADRQKTRMKLETEVRAEAAKHAAPEYIIAPLLRDPTLTVDVARETFEAFAANRTEEVNVETNRRLVDSPKPGGGKTPQKTEALPFDPNDLSPENLERAAGWWEKQSAETGA